MKLIAKWLLMYYAWIIVNMFTSMLYIAGELAFKAELKAQGKVLISCGEGCISIVDKEFVEQIEELNKQKTCGRECIWL